VDGVVPALQLERTAFSPAERPSSRIASDAARFDAFSGAVRRPLVIVAGLPRGRQALVLQALRRWNAPVYAEAPSGLRELSDLAPHRLHAAAGLTRSTFRSHFDGVIRIGDVPTLRLWRDLDETLQDVPVLSIGERPFSGLARDKARPCGWGVCSRELAHRVFEPATPSQPGAAAGHEQLSRLLTRFAGSEPGVVRSLSTVVPVGSLVMLGNSLPIREWDLAATDEDRRLTVVGNRGANGIDGLVATFLGLARGEAENWLILGDLSALYDLGALAFTPAAESGATLRVVVINNGGGRIFDSMFGDKAFVNQHGFEFSGWAQMFGWAYRLWDASVAGERSLAGVVADLPRGPVVLELRPDEAAGAGFKAAFAALQA
jgi:2-succinyl-5-enolpyruvyl-6-hydroxy-3-cyclohexene-1-carboxylate synthase